MLSFMEPLRGRFGSLVGEMSARDRTLFLGLVLFVYLAALGLAGWAGSGLLGDLQSRIAIKADALSRLETIEGEFVANTAKVTEIEATLRTTASQDLASFIEKAAQLHNLTPNLKAVREKGVSTTGNLVETSYGVELDKVTLSQLTSFLAEVEGGTYPLKIRTARLKTNGAPGTRLLTASFEVAAYKLDESATAAGGVE